MRLHRGQSHPRESGWVLPDTLILCESSTKYLIESDHDWVLLIRIVCFIWAREVQAPTDPTRALFERVEEERPAGSWYPSLSRTLRNPCMSSPRVESSSGQDNSDGLVPASGPSTEDTGSDTKLDSMKLAEPELGRVDTDYSKDGEEVKSIGYFSLYRCVSGFVFAAPGGHEEIIP